MGNERRSYAGHGGPGIGIALIPFLDGFVADLPNVDAVVVIGGEAEAVATRKPDGRKVACLAVRRHLSRGGYTVYRALEDCIRHVATTSGISVSEKVSMGPTVSPEPTYRNRGSVLSAVQRASRRGVQG
jgi:hypothetical protein